MIKEIPPGRVVALGISRDGQPQEIKVQLADRKKSMAWEPGPREFKFEMPNPVVVPDIDIPISVVIAHSSLRSGLMVENITPQLGEFFGVKNGKGVLIRSVEKGSRGEKAGFRAGDVIVKVNDQTVRDASDFTHALRGSSGKSAAVVVIREKKEQNLTLTLPDKKDSGLFIEDSFEIPEVTADVELAMHDAEAQIANLGPALEKAQECLKSQQEKTQKRLANQEKRMHKQQHKTLDRQQKMLHEFSGDWAEI
jgi:membrane-associated protease RseP (regulator of RpoE activity)